MKKPVIGTTYRLKHDVDRYPHFCAKKGAVGTLIDIDTEGAVIYIRLKMVETIDGAEDWDNEIIWDNDGGENAYKNFASDTEIIPT